MSDCENLPGFKNLPEIKYIYETKKNIIAIGDIHGDFDLLIKCLIIGDVLEEKKNKNKKDKDIYNIDNYNWIGKDTFVVQVGDQVDSCRPYTTHTCLDKNTTINDKAEDIKVLEFMTQLHILANKDKGGVISLLGNHEILNVKGTMDYVSYENIYEFSDNTSENENEEEKIKKALKKRKELFKPGNKYANFLGCTRQSAVIIGSLLFVHGNFTHFEKKIPFEKLNNMIKNWLLNKLIDNKKNSIGNIEDILQSYDKSPFWSRILGELPPNLSLEDKRCQEYIKKLQLYNVNNIIIGHTPQLNNKLGINSTCGDVVWRIDTGSSHAFDSVVNKNTGELRQAQVLKITTNIVKDPETKKDKEEVKFDVIKYSAYKIKV